MSELAISRPRGGRLEAQLRTLANAADRANKPTWVLALGGLVLAAGLIYTLAAFGSFRHARRQFDAEVANAQQAGDLLRAHAVAKAKIPDLARLYPRVSGNLGSTVEDIARQAWGIPKGQPVPGVIVAPPVQPTVSPVNAQLNTVTLDIQVNDQPLDKTFQFLDEVAQAPQLSRVFTSLVSVSPASSGWNATIRLGSFEKR